jgi:hypothetical protein
MNVEGYAESIEVVEQDEDGLWAWSATVSNGGTRRGAAASRDEAWAQARRAVDDLKPAGGGPRS